MAVLDVRGTHGSGKSWVMHQLLKRYRHTPILEGSQHLGYHLLQRGAALLGKYATDCGGCDGIESADEVCRRVRLFAGQYRVVLLEGILVSHTFKRYSELAKELGDYRFLFLNTPLNECIGRVEERRLKKGNLKPLNPNNVIKDYASVFTRVRTEATAAGHYVRVVDWQDPLPAVLEELCQ